MAHLAIKSIALAAVFAAGTLLSSAANAETIKGAMAKAYINNSQLNSARAGVRATDEGVAIAKSGYRPFLRGVASIGYQAQESTRLTTGSFGIQLEQMLFDGFQTRNNVRAAEAQVRASNESLRNTEQNILIDAASAYMDVIRDRQIAGLTSRNLEFLSEQVRAAQSRFEVGEGTRTDVAQADAQRALAVARVNSSRAQVATSEAIYRQVVGEAPGRLEPASPVGRALPPSLDQALTIAHTEHPAIRAAQHLVDAAAFSVKSAEGALLPQVSANAGVTSSYRDTDGLPGVGAGSDGWNTSASVGATLSVPIYQGGLASAQVRQSKERLGQSRIDVDVQRDQVRAALASAWSAYLAATASLSANREQVSAFRLALDGVIEERNVGQRTTLDVLNAQDEVIRAQIELISAERDAVVASYAILSAAGRLSTDRLGLAVTKYRPEEHYNAVKDKWYGTRTPDGR